MGNKTRNTIPRPYLELDPHIHKSTIPNNKLPPDAIAVDSPNILLAPLEAAVVEEAPEDDTVDAVELAVEVEATDEAVEEEDRDNVDGDTDINVPEVCAEVEEEAALKVSKLVF